MFRVGAILLAGALALWIATGVTMNLTIARQAPALVRAWWPAGVSAPVVEGSEMLAVATQRPDAEVERMRARLREAGLREPVNTQALSSLAALDEYRGDKARARQLFRLSEAMSRRNRLTEFWLIEDAVARGDIPAAIRHYDRAMRVSSEARPVLLPVLAGAASDPAILKALLPLLARRPSWWKDFMHQLASGKEPEVMAAALRATRPDIRLADERGLSEDLLRRMIALKDERGAIAAANHLEGRKGQTRSLRDGGFEGSTALLPFGWWMRDEVSLRAYRDAVPDGGMGLRIETSAGASGGVAQQLVGLAPGRYVLSGKAGDIPTDAMARPAINLNCGNGKPITRFTLPASNGEGTKFRFVFEVPANDCASQWVTIVTAPAVDTNVWIDDLSIAS